LRSLYFLVLSFLFGITAFGQQQAMYTQYMFNGLAINPAYAGSHESISATALARIQWIGIEGAPRTETFSIHSPVPGKQIAVGANFSHDQLGVSSQNTFFLTYAYRIEMSKGVLSFGLQGGINNTNVNFGELGVSTDPNLQSTLNTFKPNFGVGTYYYNNRFYAGVSIPTVVNQNSKKSIQNAGIDYEIPNSQIRHLYMTAGMLFDLSPMVKLKPSLLIKSVLGAPMAMDINANVILDDKLWLGLSYRSFDAISFLLDIQLKPQIKFGYSYDYSVTDLNLINSGSHEFMINYRFVYSKSKIVTPRYF
jgi:type IX secretion system PorP/SprF family membrane protein